MNRSMVDWISALVLQSRPVRFWMFYEMQLKDQHSFFDVDARSKDVEEFHHLLSRIRDSVGILR